MPETWHWPERMAASILSHRYEETAGVRLIQTAAPERWCVVVGYQIVSEIGAAIAQCARSEAKMAGTVRPRC